MTREEEADYSSMTDEEFDKILEELVGQMTPAQILSYGEVNMILREELNNEVLTIWEERKEKMNKKLLCLFSNYDCMNSNWLMNQVGYDAEAASYFSDLVYFLQFNPRKLYDKMKGAGFNVGEDPWQDLPDREPIVDIDDFIGELENSCGGANLWVFSVFIEGEGKKIKLTKGTRGGLFDWSTGSGSLLECPLVRDITLELGQIGASKYDCLELRPFDHGYSIEDVYGIGDEIYADAEWEVP